jgi:hypothetical protein
MDCPTMIGLDDNEVEIVGLVLFTVKGSQALDAPELLASPL